MKKLFLIFAIGALLCSCKKEDDEIIPPGINPPSETRIKFSGTFDFPQPEYTIGFSADILYGRVGESFTSGIELVKGTPNKDFSLYLDQSLDSLKGKTREVSFTVVYNYQGVIRDARIIMPVTFSDNTNLGNIGFSNYDWLYGTPRLKTVILPSGEKFYWDTKK